MEWYVIGWIVGGAVSGVIYDRALEYEVCAEVRCPADPLTYGQAILCAAVGAIFGPMAMVFAGVSVLLYAISSTYRALRSRMHGDWLSRPIIRPSHSGD